MKRLILAFAVLSLTASAAMAHCGKPHADSKGKDKTASSSQMPKAE